VKRCVTVRRLLKSRLFGSDLPQLSASITARIMNRVPGVQPHWVKHAMARFVHRRLFVNATGGVDQFIEILKIPAMCPPQCLFGRGIEKDYLMFNALTVQSKFYFESRIFGFLSL
jgi:hypothetical protein